MRAIQQVYNEPKNQWGAKPPLFDRLIDEHPDQTSDAPHTLTLTRQQLIASIEKEVTQILNTRATAKNQDYEDLIQDPLSFGLPSLFGFQDFQSFDASNHSEWPKIAQLCQQAIINFEPRLSDVSVHVEGFKAAKQSLEIHITAYIHLEKFRELVQFPIALDCS